MTQWSVLLSNRDLGLLKQRESIVPGNKIILKQIIHTVGKIKVWRDRERPGISSHLSGYITRVHLLEYWAALRRMKAPPMEGLFCSEGNRQVTL